MSGKTALIVEGGAMRGIFSCGLLDSFIEQDFFPFDHCIGVSAGASNCAAYLARMSGRNYRIYTDYSLRPEFYSRWRALRGGHLLDLDWMWDITLREMPIDYQALFSQRCELLITTTCCETGQAHYLTPTAEDLPELLKASSALPIAYRTTVPLHGRQWSDGAVSDALPVEEAYRRGARRILVLRSQPAHYQMNYGRSEQLMAMLLRDQPALRQSYLARPERYNRSLEFIRNPPPGCDIVEICPPDDFAVRRISLDRQLLESAYQQGRSQAEQVINACRDWSLITEN